LTLPPYEARKYRRQKRRTPPALTRKKRKRCRNDDENCRYGRSKSDELRGRFEALVHGSDSIAVRSTHRKLAGALVTAALPG
jgi:hypothetical protein